MISINDMFPRYKTYTDIVSATTDSWAAVDNTGFITIAEDLVAGDCIDSSGAKYVSGNDILVVMTEYTPAGDNKFINTLRAPNVGSYVALKFDNLTFSEDADPAEAEAALIKAGFVTRHFFTS
jgi:hypothetical protein